MTLSAGDRLGRYEVLAPIGAGGMGEVYRARDSELERDVAIKVLPEAVSQNPDRLERFKREAKAVAKLSHPNILEIHDYGHEDDSTYAVTELLEGRSLQEALVGGPLPSKKAIDIGAHVADGLAAAHEKSIVHRDIKPSNIFLCSDGRVKILDFGLASFEGGVDFEADTRSMEQPLTREGRILGTVGYMSPEQARGHHADHRSDIFSLGCVLYEMVSGIKPFDRGSSADTLAAILKEDPPPLVESTADTVPEVSRTIERCLEKEPGRRFQSAGDLAYNLRSISSSSATSVSHASTRPRGLRTVALWLAAVVVIVITLVLSNPGSWRQRLLSPGDPAKPGSIDSLAVLPFVNTGGDPGNEYLSDEIPASIIDRLSRLSSLRVVPRASAFSFKGTEQTLKDIGERLDVGAILTGRIRAQGNVLVIRVELVDVANDRQLWGERYTGGMADILSTEEEIATRISDALRLELTGEDLNRLVKRYTTNPEAHRLYLKGRYHMDSRDETGIKKAIRDFSDAISSDPMFARAYSGLADAHSLLAAFGFLPPADSFPEGEQAARKALEIDDSLAEAHVSLAAIQEAFHRDYPAAEKLYRRAIELDPGYPLAHLWLAFNLTCRGRFDEAAIEIQRAQELDPLSLAIHVNAAVFHRNAGRYEQADKALQIAHDLDPDNQFAHEIRGTVHADNGRFEEAKVEFKKAGGLLGALRDLGWVYAQMGMVDEAKAALAKLTDRSQRQYVPASFAASIHTALGQKDEAFEWLEKAYQANDYELNFLMVEPMFDPLHNDPRFEDLLRRLGLAES